MQFYIYLPIPTLTQWHEERINTLQIDLSAYLEHTRLCFFVSVITCADSRSRWAAIKVTSYLQGNPSVSEPASQSTITGRGGCYKLTCVRACKDIFLGQGPTSKKGQDNTLTKQHMGRGPKGVTFRVISGPVWLAGQDCKRDIYKIK